MKADLKLQGATHGSKSGELNVRESIIMVWSSLLELSRLRGHRHLDLARELESEHRQTPKFLQLATIDPSTPRRASSSSSPPITSSAVPISRSSPPSAYRRSLVTDQIYQFALGYPQTPPEPSPLLEPKSDLAREKPEDILGGMGSFVFRWYVW
ncbi:hypothetical protein XPA_003445 [Xanthoria parietina]